MSVPTEGYVLHSYGSERYLKHAVASVHTLRRYDDRRPVALYCPPHHQEELERNGMGDVFDVVHDLPKKHRSIVGFKHFLDRFKPFERSLYVDADVVWCRDPDPLWSQLSAFSFTATGLQRADHFFGGPKGFGVVGDWILQRRTRTLKRFGLTHLPRVQAGMIYAADDEATEDVCESASYFLENVDQTHFRSRLDEGRREESCEWSMAMAMSKLKLPVFPWLQGYNSPQLDYIGALTEHDRDFTEVSCRYYTVPFVYNFRGIPNDAIRTTLFSLAERLPGLGDYKEVTPFALHFGWLHQKEPFYEFANRTWDALTAAVSQPRLRTRNPADSKPVPVES